MNSLVDVMMPTLAGLGNLSIVSAAKDACDGKRRRPRGRTARPSPTSGAHGQPIAQASAAQKQKLADATKTREPRARASVPRSSPVGVRRHSPGPCPPPGAWGGGLTNARAPPAKTRHPAGGIRRNALVLSHHGCGQSVRGGSGASMLPRIEVATISPMTTPRQSQRRPR